ncbi:MAG: RIP metalloprotease RseP [Selenomonadaceae bacterium]|nr:RIP metalloprotease RseP [Selenomonadaceae bacterium]
MVLTIIAAVFVFGLLVLVHELGHFVTAKMAGMRVDEFAIGFGPKLVSVRRGETVYSIRAIPLGGFNDIAGMDPEHNTAGERGYCERPIFSRMYVILAGSLMNLVLPIFIFFGIFLTVGAQTPSSEPVLGKVMEDKPAYVAGLQSGDRIVSIDGKAIATWLDFVNSVQDSAGENLTVVYEREGVRAETQVTPEYDKQAQRALMGVLANVETLHPGLIDAFFMALERTWLIITMMLTALVNLILELSGSDLAGPIGVAQMAGEVAERGIVPLLNFTALLSLNLGIINLFPIPALDGGHFLTLIIEAVRGKPLSPKAMYYAQRVGIALLILLMLFATRNDIMRLFFGG